MIGLAVDVSVGQGSLDGRLDLLGHLEVLGFVVTRVPAVLIAVLAVLDDESRLHIYHFKSGLVNKIKIIIDRYL